MDNSKILPNIRVKKIKMTNFRNIAHAEVDLPAGKITDFTSGEPSILGIYGQNGSGKTSLILALDILKFAMSGIPLIFQRHSSCIRSGFDSSRLEFEFSAYNEQNVEFEISYSFSLCIENNHDDFKIISSKVDDDINMDVDEVLDDMGINDLVTQEGKKRMSEYLFPSDKRIKIYNELLQYSAKTSDGEKVNKQVLIDTSEEACKSSGKAFGNKKKYNQLTANCEENIDDFFNKAKIEAEIKSQSFIFTDKVLNTLIKGSNKLSYKIVLRALGVYALDYLNTLLLQDTPSRANDNYIFLNVWVIDSDKLARSKVIPINMIRENEVPEKDYILIKKGVNALGDVISKVVPGLSIDVVDVERPKGDTKIHLIRLDSIRKGVRIPLVYESDGIKRIVSFLSLIIAAFNNPSVTVAIDEIDSGIFEYMLGELLSIMKESAKGQLIFTSHNLRPLEVLSCKNLLFTTVNSENRFKKLEGISGNNNLRDSYFRCISLGKGEDAYYDATDKFSIEQALFEAGEYSEV